MPATTVKTPRLPDGVALSKIRANGIVHRIATVGVNIGGIADGGGGLGGKGGDDGRGACDPPLVMLLHGWPESWYSWRHQLVYLGRRGWPACAPDMRGYGSTESPTAVGSFDVDVLAADVLGIAERLLGRHCHHHREIVLVGHDFGAWLAWRVALLHPERFRAVVGMSVPYVGESSSVGPLERLRRQYGRSDDPMASREQRMRSQYQYMLHHCLPGAAEEYGRNIEEALYRIYSYHPGVECDKGTPEVTDRSMFLPPPDAVRNGDGGGGNGDDGVVFDARCAPSFWVRSGRPKRLPPWLTSADLAYYVSEFRRAGFEGGLSWYRSLDRNWTLLRERLRTNDDYDEILHIPCLFVCGEEDGVLRAHGGPEVVRRRMEQRCSNLSRLGDGSGVVLLKGGGHWIQQERADEVNAILGEFLSSIHQIEGAGDECARARL